MKFILSLAIVFVFVPTAFAAAAEPSYDTMLSQLKSMQAQLTNIQMKNMAQVLGVSTNNLFQVTSNNNLIAQSYVPVTKKLASDWCGDMVAMDSFKNTALVCTFEGNTICKK
jgi:hypothetical protein